VRKGTAVLVLALLVVPILAAPAHAWGMAFSITAAAALAASRGSGDRRPRDGAPPPTY
jgi:hypothetical protein